MWYEKDVDHGNAVETLETLQLPQITSCQGVGVSESVGLRQSVVDARPMPTMKPMMRVTVALAVLILVFLNNAALADTKLTIYKYWVEKEISPYPGTYRNLVTTTYVLKSNGTIITHGNGWGQNHDGVVKPGVPNVGHSFGGEPSVTRLRYDNGSIILSVFYPSYSQITTVRTNGVDSCSADVVVKLVPGHDVFLEIASKDHRTQLMMSDIHTEDVSCMIENIP